MSVAVKKIPGVESAKVSLNAGLVSIQLRPGNSVSLAQTRKAITDQGFTPKDARVTAVGDLVSANGKLELKVTGSSDVYQVAAAPHASWSKQAGKQVTVNGLVPVPEAKKGAETIQITGVTPPGPSQPAQTQPRK